MPSFIEELHAVREDEARRMDHRIGELARKRGAGPLTDDELTEMSGLCHARGVSLKQAGKLAADLAELARLDAQLADSEEPTRAAATEAHRALDDVKARRKSEEMERLKTLPRHSDGTFEQSQWFAAMQEIVKKYADELEKATTRAAETVRHLSVIQDLRARANALRIDLRPYMGGK